MMATYQSAKKPYAHQLEALDKMAHQEAFALLMAMRTGKTKTLLDDFGRLELAGMCEDLLVIAPAGVYRTWETAADDHLSKDLRERIEIFTWAAKEDSAKDKAALKRFMEIRNKPRMLLVNVEALSVVKRAQALCTAFIKQRRCMTAVDESTIIKNHSTKRTKFVFSLAKPSRYRRILSGLPTPKCPLDLYSQFYFLDPHIIGSGSWAGFRNTYAIVARINFGGRFPAPVVKGYQNLDKLRDKIAPFSYRKRLEDCYDLPPKIYMKREVPLTDEQRKAYEEIRKLATTQLASGERITATQVITQILRMHQILCGHSGTEEGDHVEIPEYRTRTLIDLLEEFDGKAIIWCSYDHDIRKVAAAISEMVAAEQKALGNSALDARKAGEAAVARFWGGNRKEREDEEKRFLNDPACRYMVATAAAGGRGRTWTVADLVVYYSNTPDLEHRSQSEERAQGIGKANSVAYVDLVAPGTVDEKMLYALRNKINMAATITGDNFREWIV